MNVGTPFVTNAQAAIAIEPRERALNDPPMPAEPFAAFNPAPRDARRDASFAQLLAQRFRVIRLVGVQLLRAFTWSTAPTLDRLNGVHRREHHPRVVDVGRREPHRERDALPVHDHMAFRARFAAIRRIRPGLIAPFSALTDEESSEARDQSMRSASPSRSSNTRWSFCRTPASCHSRSLRQQVIPEPQPISGGRYSHGRPVESTKRMPRSTSRSGMRGRPPRTFSGSGGSKGLMTAQSSSLINCLAMPDILHGELRFC
jgi:hypothetical protein